MSDEGPFRVREEVLSDGLSTVVGVLKFRVGEVVAEGDTLVAIDDDDVVLIEDEVVDPHRFSQFVLEGSGGSLWGVPLALNSHRMLVGDEQASRKRSEASCPERACDASDSSSLATRSNDLITSSDVFSIFSGLEPRYFITNRNLTFTADTRAMLTTPCARLLDVILVAAFAAIQRTVIAPCWIKYAF